MVSNKEIIKLAAAKITKQEMEKKASVIMALLTLPFFYHMLKKNLQSSEENAPESLPPPGPGRLTEGSFLSRILDSLKSAVGLGGHRPSPASIASTPMGGSTTQPYIPQQGPYLNSLSNVLNAVGNAQQNYGWNTGANSQSGGGLLSGLQGFLGGGGITE